MITKNNYSSISYQENYDDIENIIHAIQLTKKQYCLFVDLDGTLADFQLNPDECFIPTQTLQILHTIKTHSIPVIAVTGRDIAAARKLLSFVDLPVAALHGLDIYLDKENHLSIDQTDIDISTIYQNLIQACINYPELLIEHKNSAIALHYRKCPLLEDTAKNIMQQVNKKFPYLKLKAGKFVFELISPHADKGKAIEKILDYLKMPESYSAIFIGDDLTDEDGFKTVNQIKDGITIKVGTGYTQAGYRLSDTRHVADFLASFLQHIQTDNLTTSDLIN